MSTVEMDHCIDTMCLQPEMRNMSNNKQILPYDTEILHFVGGKNVTYSMMMKTGKLLNISF